MQYDITDITSGKMDGENVWVCDFRYRDRTKQPIRNVPPTYVIVTPSSETSKTIYYSHSYFRPIGKNGATSRIIKPFDNTGYRSYPGEPLKVFDHEEECVEYWNAVMDEEIEYLNERKKTVLQEIDSDIEKHKQMKHTLGDNHDD